MTLHSCFQPASLTPRYAPQHYYYYVVVVVVGGGGGGGGGGGAAAAAAAVDDDVILACIFTIGLLFRIGDSSVVKCPTRDRKFSDSTSGISGGKIFFPMVNVLCRLLFRYPFHPRVTAVARKFSPLFFFFFFSFFFFFFLFLCTHGMNKHI